MNEEETSFRRVHESAEFRRGGVRDEISMKKRHLSEESVSPRNSEEAVVGVAYFILLSLSYCGPYWWTVVVEFSLGFYQSHSHQLDPFKGGVWGPFRRVLL